MGGSSDLRDFRVSTKDGNSLIRCQGSTCYDPRWCSGSACRNRCHEFYVILLTYAVISFLRSLAR